MKAVVTGGAGMIGSHLCRQLLEAGMQVVVIDDFSGGRRDNLPEHGNLEVIYGSVLDVALVNQELADADLVFHLAASFANEKSVEDPRHDCMANAVGTINVLEACIGNRNLKRFVYASTSCVLGGAAGLLYERAPVNPGTPYAVSKHAGECYALIYQRLADIPAVVLRYFNVYGRNDYPGKYRSVIPNFIDCALRGEDLRITGTGTETREYVHVSDAVRATMLAAAYECKAAIGEIIHIGSGHVVNTQTLATLIVSFTGSMSAIVCGPRRGWDRVAHRSTNLAKASRLLNYTPKMNLENGLRDTIAWQTGITRL